MNKNILIVVLALVGLGILVFFVGKHGVTAPSMTTNTPPADQGRVVFAVTDAAPSLGAIDAVLLTVTKVEAQSATSGWVTVSSETKQFDLLQLKQSGAMALLADAKLAAGTYNQVRLTISKVEVTVGGVKKEAKLPSNVLRIAGHLAVNADQTSSVVLDFMLDKSLHVTGEGTYILLPVVRLETRSNASVDVRADHTVTSTGGQMDADVTVGADERGEMKENFMVDENAAVEIVDGKITITVSGGAKVSGTKVSVILSSQNSSGISGTATLAEVDGKVKVEINVVGGVLTLPEPAHIHAGTCTVLGGVKYALNSVVSGKSTTVINATLAQLKSQGSLAVNVHKSVAESGTYVACGNVTL